jgi:hypothetical protein
MAEISQDQFLQRYGNLMLQIWGVPALLERFKKEPSKVLTEYGLDPEKAGVTLLAPGAPNALGVKDSSEESAYTLWIQGKAAGNIPFYFVEQAPEGVAGQGLSDTELMAVAGGASSASLAINISCCCCSPCCS